MMKLFNELLNHFVDLIPSVEELEGFDIKTEKTPNGISITMVKKPQVNKDLEELNSTIVDFKSYVKTIEDFFFDEAANKFNKYADNTLKKLDVLMHNPTAENKEAIISGITLFKSCVKEAVTDYIVELQDKYELNK